MPGLQAAGRRAASATAAPMQLVLQIYGDMITFTLLCYVLLYQQGFNNCNEAGFRAWGGLRILARRDDDHDGRDDGRPG